MRPDEKNYDLRRKIYRALAGTPSAAPGTSGKRGLGFYSTALGDAGPLVRGALKVTLTEVETGRETVVVDEKNLVVAQAGALMADMAAGTLNSDIGYIELGDPVAVLPPSLTDTNLQQTTGQRQATAAVVTGNSVTFTATWLAAQGNGFTYTEAGLFTNPMPGGTMFARKTGFTSVKTNAFQMTFTWVLTFSVLDACQEACYGVSLVGSSYVVEDYIYDAAGGETQVVVPIDFVVAAKRLEVFLNGLRLYYTRDYIELNIGANKGVQFNGFTLIGPAADALYFRHLRW